MRKIKIAQIGTSLYSHGSDIFKSLTKQKDVFHIRISHTLIMILSITPPKYPARPPAIIPRTVIINTARKLTISETRPPYISLDKTS